MTKLGGAVEEPALFYSVRVFPAPPHHDVGDVEGEGGPLTVSIIEGDRAILLHDCLECVAPVAMGPVAVPLQAGGFANREVTHGADAFEVVPWLGLGGMRPLLVGS